MEASKDIPVKNGYRRLDQEPLNYSGNLFSPFLTMHITFETSKILTSISDLFQLLPFLRLYIHHQRNVSLNERK